VSQDEVLINTRTLLDGQQNEGLSIVQKPGLKDPAL
jgi:hypothetical protein